MNTKVEHLGRLLSEAEHLAASSSSSNVNDLFEKIARLALQEKVYKDLWSERILNQLLGVFERHNLDLEIFAGELKEIKKRSSEVSQINDLFFAILDPDSSPEQLAIFMAILASIPTNFPFALDESDRLAEIRNQDLSSTDKIRLFLEFMKDDHSVDLLDSEAIQGVLQILEDSERVGVANALFIDSAGNGSVIPLHLKIQAGLGNAHCGAAGNEIFQASIQRAQYAMKDRGHISNSEDVICVPNLTDMHYEGSSIAVAAAAAIYSVKRGLPVDAYTTFTGNISLDGQNWVIEPVKHVQEKINAAKRAGCRRIFVPEGNREDIAEASQIKIYFVSSLEDIFVQLHPGKDFRPGDSLQGNKIKAIQLYSGSQGWDLNFQSTQSGLQVTVIPLEHSPLNIQVYSTGTHTVRTDLNDVYGELLTILDDLDTPAVPVRPINETLNMNNESCRIGMKSQLEKWSGTQSITEAHCIFSFKFKRSKETLTVKQFKTGSLTIQGSAGPLYKEFLDVIIPIYKAHFPNSNVTVEDLLNRGIEEKTDHKTPMRTEIAEIPLPHIGTDESGKGDYYGSMVVAGVFLDSESQTALLKIGVKDSKLLSDKRIREKAVEIRNAIPGKYHEVEITPEKYNQLYDQFRSEKKNLNHLLAWGHARAIEDLLKRFKCLHAVADQFGDEHYIQSKLMEKGKNLQLIQVTKGERYLAVAAASILARDRFLARMEMMKANYGIDFPKGGSSDKIVEAAKDFVQKFGKDELRKIAKVHHKTTNKIDTKGEV